MHAHYRGDAGSAQAPTGGIGGVHFHDSIIVLEKQTPRRPRHGMVGAAAGAG
jgi:hypothetical protein